MAAKGAECPCDAIGSLGEPCAERICARLGVHFIRVTTPRRRRRRTHTSVSR